MIGRIPWFAIFVFLILGNACSHSASDTSKDCSLFPEDRLVIDDIPIEQRVFVAPTWDLTTLLPNEISEDHLRQGLMEIRDSFGTGRCHGPYASPAITLYALYESPNTFSLENDKVLLRNLRLVEEIGLPFRIILHGGRFTGTLCEEEPLQCFFKQSFEGWLQANDDGIITEAREGAETPPFVSISRYHSALYVRKMRNLRRATQEILEWVSQSQRRRSLFLGFSKDPETMLAPPDGRTVDPLTLAEYDDWLTRDGIYQEGIWTAPVDYHQGLHEVSDLEIQGIPLQQNQWHMIHQSEQSGAPHTLILIDPGDLGLHVFEGMPLRYTVVGGEDDGSIFETILWCFSDDPEQDNGEWFTKDTGDDTENYRAFMNALVDHHVTDIIQSIQQGFEDAAFESSTAARSRLIYTHEIPGGVWTGSETGPTGDGEYDYTVISQASAPLCADPHGNWSSVAQVPGASLGLDVFGALCRDQEILSVDAQLAEISGVDLGLLEWNPDSDEEAIWEESLNLAASYQVRFIGLQGWEEVTENGNEAAREAMADFLVRFGDSPTGSNHQ